MKWAMFFMGEYAHLIVGGAFFTMLFLGGWSINPTGLGPDLPAAGGILVALLQVGVTLAKVFLMVFLALVLRWTLPRFRFDQLMRLAWEGMIPTALLMLLVTSFFVYQGWTGWMWAGSLLVIAIMFAVHPLMPKQANPNHRVRLIGSRFSPADP
jgi:NADH-quinone oxidoreductase subunit H